MKRTSFCTYLSILGNLSEQNDYFDEYNRFVYGFESSQQLLDSSSSRRSYVNSFIGIVGDVGDGSIHFTLLPFKNLS